VSLLLTREETAKGEREAGESLLIERARRAVAGAWRVGAGAGGPPSVPHRLRAVRLPRQDQPQAHPTGSFDIHPSTRTYLAAANQSINIAINLDRYLMLCYRYAACL